MSKYEKLFSKPLSYSLLPEKLTKCVSTKHALRKQMVEAHISLLN